VRIVQPVAPCFPMQLMTRIATKLRLKKSGRQQRGIEARPAYASTIEASGLRYGPCDAKTGARSPRLPVGPAMGGAASRGGSLTMSRRTETYVCNDKFSDATLTTRSTCASIEETLDLNRMTIAERGQPITILSSDFERTSRSAKSPVSGSQLNARVTGRETMTRLTHSGSRAMTIGATLISWSLTTIVSALQNAMKHLFDSYRPELHYMRGPGPKWHEKHAGDSAASTSSAGWRLQPLTPKCAIIFCMPRSRLSAGEWRKGWPDPAAQAGL
jgi:hypothetical protein